MGPCVSVRDDGGGASDGDITFRFPLHFIALNWLVRRLVSRNEQ